MSPARWHLPTTMSARLVLLSTFSLVSATLLVFLLVAYQQERLLRGEWVESLSAQASLIATNSRAAIAFDDAIEAVRLLAAVENNAYVLRARLLLPNGETFARYNRPGATLTFDTQPPPTATGYVFGAETMTVWAPVRESGKTLATVELVASLAPMREAFARTAMETGIVLLLALVLSLWLSRRVVRHLSAPVEELNGLMQRLAADMTLPQRAQTKGNNEIAGLARGLNHLVDTVQARDRELAQYRNNLEQLVKQRTQALNRAIEEARQANEAKSTFLARISHEIRTPMNAIVGLGRLLMKTRLDAQQRDYQEKVLASADALLGIINDLLDYSRIEAGKLSLESIPFDLNQVLHRVSGLVAYKAQEKGLELLFLVEPDVPRRPVGDPLRLGQVLVNLISNAVKFTETGEVVVLISRKSETAGRVTLEFSVRDTGIGIPPERLPDLFNPFTQVDDSITRRFGGTGLGLSICKQLVEMMEGEIGVESTPGRGSHFHFTATLGLGEQPATSERHSHHLKGRTALVVDDNASARLVLARMLEHFGLRVDTCASGEESLPLLRAAVRAGDLYDLVLLDWLMPGMDGIETSRRIHVEPSLEHLPAILMITASGYEAISPMMASAGLAQLLVKPISESSLHDALLEVLLGSGTAAEQSRYREQQRATRFDFGPIRGARVLLVDDVALNRDVARAILREAGVRVDMATQGRMAVEKVSRGGYDLVLMDIQMPVLDGLAATREIRADPRFRDLPIIAMTAHAMTEDRTDSFIVGMNDYLTKPIDPDALFTALLRWIPAADYQARNGVLEETLAADTAWEDKTTVLPPLAGLDMERGLANHLGRPGLYRRMLVRFQREFANADERIGGALAQGDQEQARRIAHSAKSAAASIGAGDLEQAARALEQFLAMDQPADAALAAFSTILGRVAEILAPLAEAEQAAPVGPVADVAQPDSALALVERMRALLAEDDADAESLLGPLEASLAGTAWRESVARLRDLVEDIEYEAALAELERLRQGLEETN